MAALPPEIAAWFAGRGWRVRRHQSEMLAAADAGRRRCLRAESPHGRKYVIVGRIESPDGKSALVQTIWIVDTGTDVARLVTAYPHQE